MAAYAKLSLVSSVFHPSDIGFARAWSEMAPGIDGWRLVLDREDAPERVSVIPPGAEAPVFLIIRDTRDVVLSRRGQPSPAGWEEIGHFANLREAVLALCQLSDDVLEEIHERLELDFPRRDR